MLTAEKEGGQIKAHNYWQDGHYGPFSVQQLSERKASLEPAKIHRHRHRPSAGSRKSSIANDPVARLDPKEAAQSDQPYVTVRKITLSHADFPFQRMREITQLQYSSWPDFGAPAHPTHLLGLVEQCNNVVRSMTGTKHTEPEAQDPRPVLVHCSAGCGRTGTFCTVDSVIDMLKRQRASRRHRRQGTPMEVDTTTSASNNNNKQDSSPFFASSTTAEPQHVGAGKEHIDGEWLGREDQDLVEKTVEDFRLQRLSMVQSLRQFVLCYETVLEWLREEERQEHEDA